MSFEKVRGHVPSPNFDFPVIFRSVGGALETNILMISQNSSLRVGILALLAGLVVATSFRKQVLADGDLLKQ